MTQFEKAQKSPACLPQSPQASQNSCLENPCLGGEEDPQTGMWITGWKDLAQGGMV